MQSFSKYSGCGNDFLLFDNRSNAFPRYDKSLIIKMCQRRLGIGADGIVLLENSQTADFRMRIFNADGNEAEMCGNGIRCLMKFIRSLGVPNQNLSIETMQERVHVSYDKDQIGVSMPAPKDMRWSIELPIDSDRLILHYLDTGVPHAVIFTEDANAVNLEAIAPQIRFDPLFSPRGTNVNFATIKTSQVIQVRTYERGVEQETLACGTGAVAVAIAAAAMHNLQSPIYIQTGSKELLEIRFAKESQAFTDVMMIGPATFVFNGEIDLSVSKSGL